ncbi:MAG TPA: hypothetical protein VFI61_00070 [Patescibacteria group bacterium]|nr:hypothetical protein [Patescibacteria group bacterium]
MTNFLTQEIGNPALGPTLQGFSQSEGGSQFFSTIIPNAIMLAFIIGSLVFFFMLVMGSIQWITSGGDKQKLESARGRITSALIGIVLLFASFAIIKLIENFFGIQILTLDILPLKI